MDKIQLGWCIGNLVEDRSDDEDMENLELLRVRRRTVADDEEERLRFQGRFRGERPAGGSALCSTNHACLRQ